MQVEEFASKLVLTLKILSMSRGRCAVELGVSKSLVSRWASGAVTPSPHNLERLTHLVAAKHPGFTMMDWDRAPADLARFLGADPAMATPTPATAPRFGLAPQIIEASRAAIAVRGASYEGFWRLTRPAVVAPGRFCRDHGMLRRGEGGLLDFDLGNPDLRFAGSALAIEGQLFAIANDTIGHLPSFLIFNAVSMPKNVLLDGIILTALNALRKPAAYPILLERIGDLSGDRARDDAMSAELMRANPQFVEHDEVPEPVRAHLLRDVGPAAMQQGAGDLLLAATMSDSLTRVIAHLSGRAASGV